MLTRMRDQANWMAKGMRIDGLGNASCTALEDSINMFVGVYERHRGEAPSCVCACRRLLEDVLLAVLQRF